MKIRRAGVADWELVRDLRLRALADAPEAFGSTYEREVAFDDTVWIERLGAEANATLLCEADAKPCGIVILIRDTGDRSLGFLVSMWIAPTYRGSGAADALVTALLDWARADGVDMVRLHVAEGNERAERLYRRHGFERTGNVFTGGREGLIEIEMERR